MKHFTVTLQIEFDYDGPEIENLQEAIQKVSDEIENEAHRAPEGVTNVKAFTRVSVADVHEADPPTCEGCCIEPKQREGCDRT